MDICCCKSSRVWVFVLLVAALLLLICPNVSAAATINPSLTINTSKSTGISDTEVYSGFKLALFVSSLVFIPSLLMCMTCFTRIAIVLALTRQSLGLMQSPPNQVLLGLALFLTFAVMGPTFHEIYQNSFLPYSEDQIGTQEAIDKGFKPLREFMLKHTREQDLNLFMEIAKVDPPETPESLTPMVVIPAFLLSELNTAFQIGFLIFLPFLVLDMIVSSVLTSMSMITLPPTIISLPLKLMLFVVINGWSLIIGNLVKSYSG